MTTTVGVSNERSGMMGVLEKFTGLIPCWFDVLAPLPRGETDEGGGGMNTETGCWLAKGCGCPAAVKNAVSEGSLVCGGQQALQVHPVDVESGNEGEEASGPVVSSQCEHKHYSHRAPWLRALVLGANDGLVSIASLMLGVGAVDQNNVKTMVVGGLAGLVAGACSMAIGEFVSVYSQRDSEKADVEKERQEHAKGPEAVLRELEELAQIYVDRGLSYPLAKQVAKELSDVDPIKAHARDELGIDIDEYSNPGQAALASAVAFASGASIPLLAGCFIADFHYRLAAVIASTSLALALFGALGARLGGAPVPRAAFRVLVGGALAMAVTFGVLKAFGLLGVSL